MMQPDNDRFADVGRGIRLCYQELGAPDGRPLLLIAGLGQQLISWPTPFCEALVERGFRVIRFDNRDAGRSTHLPFAPPSMAAIMLGRFPREQYTLADLARDAVGLLDALEVDAAHVAGASMGGMIAQTIAAHFPARLSTLTSMMSTTGAPGVGRPALSTWRRIRGRPPRTRGEAMDRAVHVFRHIGSHEFAFDEPTVRAVAGQAWDRDSTTGGTARQLGAIFASKDRTSEVTRIQAPTLVVHGDRDRMVHPTGGLATHRAIAGSRLVTIRGMGHDCPVGAWPQLIDLLDRHALQAESRPSPSPLDVELPGSNHVTTPA